MKKENEQIIPIELFKHQLEVFKTNFLFLPLVMGMTRPRKDELSFSKSFNLSKEIYHQPLFNMIQEQVGLFEKQRDEKTYHEIVDLLNDLVEEIKKDYSGIGEENEQILKEEFEIAWKPLLWRHKHLFKHFLLGLKSIIGIPERELYTNEQ